MKNRILISKKLMPTKSVSQKCKLYFQIIYESHAKKRKMLFSQTKPFPETPASDSDSGKALRARGQLKRRCYVVKRSSVLKKRGRSKLKTPQSDTIDDAENCHVPLTSQSNWASKGGIMVKVSSSGAKDSQSQHETHTHNTSCSQGF